MSEQANVNISVIELSQTDCSVLKVAIGLLEKNEIKARILNKGDTSGSIVLVDFDTPAGKEFYSQFKNGRSRTLLLFSNDTISDPSHFVLKKPIRVQTLRDVLYDAYKGLTVQTPTFVKSTRQEDKKTVLIPNKNLFSVLLKTTQDQQIVHLFCPPHSSLFVDTVNGMVASSVSRNTLRQLIINQPTSLITSKLSSSDFESLAKGKLIMPLNFVLWTAALYGSHGQLIPGHSMDVPVQLKAWPNLSRLDFEPEHMKLASIMSSQALTLKQIEQKSKLPWNTIVNFYNATYAIGLIVIKPANLPIISHQRTPIKVGLLTDRKSVV